MNKSLLIFFAVIAVASAVRLPIDIKAAVGKIDNLLQKDVKFESEGMADLVPEGTYESESMADLVPEGTYESESMADVVPEGTYESESMADPVAEIAPQPPVAVKSIKKKIQNMRQVPAEVPAFETEHMADNLLETKDMADTPFETVDMKDEYEHEGMADEVVEEEVNVYAKMRETMSKLVEMF